MFERFTDQARRVVVVAQQESETLGHNYIGTEHILLGLIREGDGVGAQALTRAATEHRRSVIAASAAELDRLRRVVRTLQAQLRRHGIEPEAEAE